jgi:hypothetical protein
LAAADKLAVLALSHLSRKNKNAAKVGHPAELSGLAEFAVTHPGDKNKSIAKVGHL